ncbi:hypothetical protein JOF45_001875 [Nesterenkonia lacusekhoensis]|uniref:Uncharacterized protein n=1 Tax=Nesterenkonia lacusekhoensis TaxID=150832 RepID=A0ABS4T332_9MICC|nr:hypothetical protein [Nesterenkonia lacusekhoensis]
MKFTSMKTAENMILRTVGAATADRPLFTGRFHLSVAAH